MVFNFHTLCSFRLVFACLQFSFCIFAVGFGALLEGAKMVCIYFTPLSVSIKNQNQNYIT